MRYVDGGDAVFLRCKIVYKQLINDSSLPTEGHSRLPRFTGDSNPDPIMKLIIYIRYLANKFDALP